MSKRTIAIIHDHLGRSLTDVLPNFKVLNSLLDNNTNIIFCETNSSFLVGGMIPAEYKEMYDKFIKVNIDKFVSLAHCNNVIINKAKKLDKDVEFIHIFHDDLIINDNYNPELYEEFMQEFNLGYYSNPRLNPLNYVFSKLSPRLIIDTKKYSKSSINLFAYEGKEYTVIDCKKNNLIFDEKLNKLYNIEYIYRCKHAGIIPFLNFYFDHTIVQKDMIRDNTKFAIKHMDSQTFTTEEQYLNEVLKVNWVHDSNADAVIDYIRAIKGV